MRRLIELADLGIDIYRHDGDELTALYGMLPTLRAQRRFNTLHLNAPTTKDEYRYLLDQVEDDPRLRDRLFSDYLVACNPQTNART